MCNSVAEGLRLQRGREYGFYNEDFTSMAAIITEILDIDLELIPSNNLICERNLSKFSQLAENSAKYSNHHFKGKGIRDDITLYKANQMNKLVIVCKLYCINVKIISITSKKSTNILSRKIT